MIDLIRLLHSFFKNHNKNNILTICGQRAQNCAGCRYRPWPRCRHGKGLWLARLLTLPISNAGIPAPKIFGTGIFLTCSHSEPFGESRSHSETKTEPFGESRSHSETKTEPFVESRSHSGIKRGHSELFGATRRILKRASQIVYGWL